MLTLYLAVKNFEIAARIISNNCNSQFSEAINIEISSIPNDFYKVNEEEIFLCENDFISIEAQTDLMGLEIMWTSPNPEINLFNQDQSTVSISNLREGENTIILNSSFGSCTDYAFDTINIIRLVDIVANDDIATIPNGGNTLIDILENDDLNGPAFINRVNTDADVEVNEVGSQLQINTDNIAFGEIELLYEICYINCPSLCSEAIVRINIEANTDCFASNLITPNNDGYNDKLLIPCLTTGEYPNNRISIYNQWGDLVFEAMPYENNWEGTFENDALPSGTYYYNLQLDNNQNETINGFLVIER